MKYNVTTQGNDIKIEIDKLVFDIGQTLDCGQCFRFSLAQYDDDTTIFTGIVGDKFLKVSQDKSGVVFHDTTPQDLSEIWHKYFDLDTDYEAIKQGFMSDDAVKTSIEYAGGIRILSQPSFEALISFIISQNNNIPRIKNSINKFCERFGEKITNEHYSFPTVENLLTVKKEDLQGLSLGYRDDYIVDCIQKISTGELILEEVCTLDIEQARVKLRTIKGVGPKVAECALLFGFHRLEAFPIDTWIKKVIKHYYQDGFPHVEYAGVAQQYLFHYMRTCETAPKV